MTKAIVVKTDEDDKTLLGDSTDALRELLARTLNNFMQEEVTARIGFEHHERSDEPREYRNGIRPRQLHSRMGELALEVPRLRNSSYQPSFLERYQRTEKALIGLIQQAFVAGISTRKMQKVVEQLGITSLSKSQVSELCADLDIEVEAFRTRPLTDKYPYLMFDAVYEKVRIDKRVQSQAVVAAYGITDQGVRELLDLDIVETESYEGWSEFFRRLIDRGLKGGKLVVSDAHSGLVKAIREVLVGTTWQRCKVHFLRNVLAAVPKTYKEQFTADIKRLYHVLTREQAMAIVEEIIDKYANICSRAVNILIEGVGDTLSYLDFPSEHWPKISSTNPIERMNREIRRRTRVVGVFPDRKSAIRLIGMVLLDQTEEWATQRGYMSADSMQLIT
jgi:putative transposase